MNIRSRMLVGAALAISLVFAGSAPALAATVSWTSPSTVASSDRLACDHSLAASTTSTGTRLHAVWVVVGAGGYLTNPPLVYYRASTTNGASWTTPLRMSGLSKTWKGCPLVAASGSFVVVGWTQGGTRSIRLRVSRDGGRTWSAERIVPTTRTPGEPSLAVVGTRIFLSWTDAGVSPHWSRSVTSADGGMTWTGGRLDSSASDGSNSWAVTTQIAASGSTVLAAWLRSNGTDLMGRWSTNGGGTWSAPTLLATLNGTAAAGRGFSVAARPDRLAVAWGDADRPLDQPSPLVHVRVYASGAWGAPLSLTAAPPIGKYGIFSQPLVTLLASTRVGLAWAGCTDKRVADPASESVCAAWSDILWSESTDGGTTWTPAVVVDTATPAFSLVASAVWSSAALRGVLVTHDGHPLTFRRGFEAT